MDVGIRELKARLSHYVKAASAGERIVITDRGSPVAVLAPARTDEHVDIPPALQQLIAEGRATAPSRPMPLPPVTPFTATRSVEEILAEDRGED
jgi:prevent-host-death family protein